AGARPTSESGDHAVRLEPGERRALGRNQSGDLFANLLEHVRGPGTFRDERRDPPQRRLLFGKTTAFAGILHVRAPLREWPSTIRSMASAERADFRQDSRLAELG